MNSILTRTFLELAGAAFLLMSQLVVADVPRDPAESAAWKARILANIDRDSLKPANEAVPLMADRIFALSQPWNRSPDSSDVFNRAQATLLAIPGHAKYYQDKIEAMRAEAKGYPNLSEEDIRAIEAEGREAVNVWTYDRYCGMIAFPTLALMPSPETVAVLGHFLNDPEGRDGKNAEGGPIKYSGGGRMTVNAEAATIAIRKLGIENPPAQEPKIQNGPWAAEEEVDAWKSWWNEVAAGRRTYRFIGSPVEYGPDGPVSGEKLKQVKDRQRREWERKEGIRHRPVDVQPEESPLTASITHNSGTLAGILAACVLVAGAVWYYFRARRRRKG